MGKPASLMEDAVTYFVTRTTIDPNNHPRPWVIGQVRRLADEFGRPGILAKKGQDNDRVRKKGYLRLAWRFREQAERYQLAADEMYGDRTVTRVMRNRRRYPWA